MTLAPKWDKCEARPLPSPVAPPVIKAILLSNVPGGRNGVVFAGK